MKHFVLFLSFVACSGNMYAQSPIPSVPENCKNGIDDDGDGKIDLNDPECFCVSDPSAFSLLPNPSFELHNCCPVTVSQTACMENWFQAGYGTTDYMNDWRPTDLNSGVYFYLAEVDQFNGETLKKQGTIHILNE